jgi:ribosomal-protein-alanine N-acetyltransferase
MIKTNRCLLVQLQESDFNDIEKLYINSEVRKYLGGMIDKKTFEVNFSDMLNAKEDTFNWVVRENSNNEFIGLISLHSSHDGTCTEVSYQLLPKWWGKGIATEAVDSVIHFAFTELNLSSLIAETQVLNLSSRRLLEKLGMKLDKKIMRFGAEQAIYCIERNSHVRN